MIALRVIFQWIVALSLFVAVGTAAESAPTQSKAVETARDIYHGTEGPVSGPPAPVLSYPANYGRTGPIDGRSLLWIFIQQHFYLGSFILGVPMLGWILELAGHLRRRPDSSLDRLGREVIHLGLPFYPFAVFTGVALLGVFLFAYGGFFRYMAGLFKPVMFLYALAFLLESALFYAYARTWDRWQTGRWKWHHLTLGVLICTNGIVIIALANAWMAFMMSPAGVDSTGRFLGDTLTAVRTPFWYPLNVHRILASIMFSGAVIAAYAAWRTMTTRDPDLRAHYDRLGHVSIMIAMMNLLLLPFAGYWFARVIFMFRQRMGVTLMGGILSWPFVVQAMLIGLIFMTVTYYLWQGVARMNGAERYRPLSKYMFAVMAIAFAIWATPHTLPASQSEFGAMGGTQHPIVGNYGTMAAKNTAINTMILTFGIGLMIFRRCNRLIVGQWSPWGNIALGALFVGAEANIIFLGVYGTTIPANVRVGLALPQFLSAVSALAIGGVINAWMLKGAPSLGPIRWGQIPVSGSVSLIVLAVLISMTMALMGYIRSAVRLNWHVTEIMRDATPWATIPGLPYTLGMVLLNVALFAGFAAWLFRSAEARRADERLPLIQPDPPDRHQTPPATAIVSQPQS